MILKVAIQVDELNEFIKILIKDKYKLPNDFELHRTSKTKFLTFNVIVGYEWCDCDKCEQKRLEVDINET